MRYLWFCIPIYNSKSNWKGNRVCEECYEPKHPQNDPPFLTVDAEALFQPRTEVPLPQAQLGRVFTDNPGNVNPDEDLIGTKFSLYAVTSSLGNITVSATDGSQTVSTNFIFTILSFRKYYDKRRHNFYLSSNFWSSRYFCFRHTNRYY